MSEVTFSGNTIGDKAIYLTGVERGKKQEQERIIKLWNIEMACDCEDAMNHLKQRIKGENK